MCSYYNPVQEFVMPKDGASTARRVPVSKFEPPRLKPLGSLLSLTKSLIPGNDTDFTMTSF